MNRVRVLVVVAIVTLAATVPLAVVSGASTGGRRATDRLDGFALQPTCSDGACVDRPMYVHARSAPDGTGATGTVHLEGVLDATVSCLAVDGRHAVVAFEPIAGIGIFAVLEVVDRGGRGDQVTMGVMAGSAPTVCPDHAPPGTNPAGSFRVHDA